MQERGFTLLETLAVVVIAGILLASTLPGFSKFRSTLRRGQAVQQVTQDMRSARQSAVTQRLPVIVAFGNGVGTTDITTYTIHVDTNGDRIYQTTEPRTSKTMPSGTRLFRVSMSPVDSLFFDISGVLVPGSSGGSVVVASTSSSITDTLLVSGAGMVYQQ